jgi:hypothetical protein
MRLAPYPHSGPSLQFPLARRNALQGNNRHFDWHPGDCTAEKLRLALTGSPSVESHATYSTLHCVTRTFDPHIILATDHPSQQALPTAEPTPALAELTEVFRGDHTGTLQRQTSASFRCFESVGARAQDVDSELSHGCVPPAGGRVEWRNMPRSRPTHRKRLRGSRCTRAPSSRSAAEVRQVW